jgi:hypothetical protein
MANEAIKSYAAAVVAEAATLATAFEEMTAQRTANKEAVRMLIKQGHVTAEQRAHVDEVYPSLFKPRAAPAEPAA